MSQLKKPAQRQQLAQPQPLHPPERTYRRLLDAKWNLLINQQRQHLHGGRIGEVQFPRPVRPGDTLRVVSDIVQLRPSASRPDRGIARLRQVTINQRGEQVMEQETTVFLKRRPAA